jgi:hypothetical protein
MRDDLQIPSDRRRGQSARLQRRLVVRRIGAGRNATPSSTSQRIRRNHLRHHIRNFNHMHQQGQLVPDLLFHYTTATGLMGIVEKNQLWATSLEYMNDASELTLAIEKVVPLLRARGLEGLANNITPGLMALDPDYLQRITVCAVCFSTEGDLLSQWRAYGASGSGYALGFRGPQLAQVAQRKGWQLAKCLYKDDEHEQALSALVDKAIQQVESGAGFVNALQQFWTWLLQAAVLIKHKGFREEQEWRLVSVKIGMRDMRYRVGQSMLIPYETMDFDKELLSVLRVGPQRHQNLAVAALREYMSCKAHDLVEGSVIPFRTLS